MYTDIATISATQHLQATCNVACAAAASYQATYIQEQIQTWQLCLSKYCILFAVLFGGLCIYVAWLFGGVIFSHFIETGIEHEDIVHNLNLFLHQNTTHRIGASECSVGWIHFWVHWKVCLHLYYGWDRMELNMFGDLHLQFIFRAPVVISYIWKATRYENIPIWKLYF